MEDEKEMEVEKPSKHFLDFAGNVILLAFYGCKIRVAREIGTLKSLSTPNWTKNSCTVYL
ncbi:hypothetical protein NPIL_348171, partial [Nephila pilipes]